MSVTVTGNGGIIEVKSSGTINVEGGPRIDLNQNIYNTNIYGDTPTIEIKGGTQNDIVDKNNLIEIFKCGNFTQPSSSLFFDTIAQFPVTGESDKIYVSKDNGISWTWNTNYNKYLDNHGRLGFAVVVLNENNLGTILTATYLINTLGSFTFSIQPEEVGFLPKLYSVSNINLTNNKTFVSYVQEDNISPEREFIMTQSLYEGGLYFGVYISGNFEPVNHIIDKVTLIIEVYP